MIMNSTPGTVAASKHSMSAEKTAIEQENDTGTVKVICVNQRHFYTLYSSIVALPEALWNVKKIVPLILCAKQKVVG
jgi:hypothetical protein